MRPVLLQACGWRLQGSQFWKRSIKKMSVILFHVNCFLPKTNVAHLDWVFHRFGDGAVPTTIRFIGTVMGFSEYLASTLSTQPHYEYREENLRNYQLFHNSVFRKGVWNSEHFFLQ